MTVFVVKVRTGEWSHGGADVSEIYVACLRRRSRPAIDQSEPRTEHLALSANYIPEAKLVVYGVRHVTFTFGVGYLNATRHASCLVVGHMRVAVTITWGRISPLSSGHLLA